MKHIVWIVSALVCVSIQSCMKEHVSETKEIVRVAVIGDPTDPRASSLQAAPIFALYEFGADPGREAYFRFTTISDRQLNPVCEYHLANRAVTEEQNRANDPDHRARLLAVFYDSIHRVIADYSQQCSTCTSLPFSECYRTIASELTLLAESPGTRYMVIHSDLQEKSDIFNCYTASGWQQMRKNPQKIAEIFSQAHLLPDDLSHVTVFFVFTARDRDEDAKFMAMAEVYKSLLKERHAKVIVQANANFLNAQ